MTCVVSTYRLTKKCPIIRCLSPDVQLDGIWNMESAFTEFMIISCYRKDPSESAKTSLLLLLSILLNVSNLITRSLVWCIFVQSPDNHPLVTSHITMDVWIVGTITGISCYHILFSIMHLLQTMCDLWLQEVNNLNKTTW